MSFNKFKTHICENDTVILYLTINQIYSVIAKPTTLSKKGQIVENVFQTPFGALKCSELIGVEYGSKINLSKGWGYVLQPTPELWTLTLPHRTQIIYTPDISIIILQLEISPGSVVVECGTGSGSLSHALIRTIKPHGHLYTFDFHENRVKIANEEFKEHGLENYVTIGCRDVCTNGFGEDLYEKADAVFLDVPHPWLAIPHAFRTLKETGGRLCSFSPCIEQVQKSCFILKQLGFEEIQTMEILQTQYSIQTRHLNVIDLEFLKTEKDPCSEKQEKEIVKCLTSIAPSSQPGHTGFLSFATLPPIWGRNLQMFDDKNFEDQ